MEEEIVRTLGTSTGPIVTVLGLMFMWLRAEFRRWSDRMDRHEKSMERQVEKFDRRIERLEHGAGAPGVLLHDRTRPEGH